MENILAASSLCRAHRRWGCTARISIHSPHGLQRRVNGASQRADAHGGSSSKDAVWHSVLAMIHALSFLHSCDDRGCFITCCFPLLKLLWAAGPLDATGNDCSTPPSICEGHSEAALILTVGHDYGETSASESSPIRHVMPPDEKVVRHQRSFFPSLRSLSSHVKKIPTARSVLDFLNYLVAAQPWMLDAFQVGIDLSWTILFR